MHKSKPPNFRLVTKFKDLYKRKHLSYKKEVLKVFSILCKLL